MQGCDQHIDYLDSKKWDDNSSSSIHDEVPTQHCSCGHWLIGHTTQGEWDKGNDNQGIENHRGKNCRFTVMEMHDVERIKDGEYARKHSRNNGEILGNIIRDRKRCERTARH